MHLVDLDDVAPAQAVAQLPETLQKRITLHGGLDLSGVLARIDRWGDLTPGSADLMSFVAETSAAIAARIGRTFDVVLSACLLSQLYLPIRESLVLNLGDWQRLCGAVDRAHLATVAALTRSGGTGVLALDTTHSHKLPELAAFTAPETWGDLETAVDAAMARRGVSLDPDPKRLIEMLQAGDFQPAVERPRVSGTWVWDSGGGVYALIKALLFQRA